jgi:hypothetical protein
MRRPLPEPSRGTRVPGLRTLLAFGLVLAVLLALVAVASRSAVGGRGGEAGTGGGAPALPTWFSSYLYTFVIVAGFFVLLLGFVLARREEMGRGRSSRRSALATIALLLACVAILVAAVREPQKISQLVERIRPGGLDADAVPRGAAANVTPQFEWMAVAVASSLSIAVVAGVLAYPFLRRRVRRRVDGALVEALSSALENTVDDVRAEPDPRRAIILAYARMEAVLDAHGLPRHEAEAPLEYLARVLLELDVGAPPVETLTELFERAKFSHHTLGTPDKERAIDALETIRAELRAR